VTLAGSLAGALKTSLQLSNTEIGIASSAYLAGAVLGALFFGWLTDRLGRKKLFFVTLSVYLVATAATATSWSIESFALFRFLTGAGIGGEYTAINSTIQELVPARVRGWTDLVINGTFWIGAALGALGSLVLLDAQLFDPDFGWRLGFLIGAGLACFIFLMRLWIPESPRWLMTHGRVEEARACCCGNRKPICTAASHPVTTTRAAACPEVDAALAGQPDTFQASPSPNFCRLEPDGSASIFLQRDFFHLRSYSDRLFTASLPIGSVCISCHLPSEIFLALC
jgi:MFS family permease